MDKLPDLTAKQQDALNLFRQAWKKREEAPPYFVTRVKSEDSNVGIDGWAQVIHGCINGFSFGATTIATLKRHGLITKEKWGYRVSDEVLALDAR